jgi:heme oxygenase
MQVTLENSTAFFDFDDVHGNCEFKITNITDESYEVEITNVSATQVIGEVELDYILTDTQLDQLNEEIIWCIQDTDMVRDMQDPMNYFDEDEWRYDA